MVKLVLSFLIFGLSISAFGQTAFKKAVLPRNSQSAAGQREKMNVIFFLVDDLGWSDIGVNGSSFYETPNIDRFAKEGVRFTQAYSTCHVCSPSRASIMTGKYPARLNLTDWLTGRQDFPFQKLKNVVINQHLPFKENTLPEVLVENGYQTAIFGKWHLGEEESSPLKHGFKERLLTDWNKGWPNKGFFAPYDMAGLEGGAEGEYLTDRLTSEAIRYIEKNKDAPFFLYLSHFAVHDPIQGRPDLVKKYTEKLSRIKRPGGERFILEGNPDTPEPFTREQLNKFLSQEGYEGFGNLPNRTVKIKQHQDNVEFAAMVESVDESMGHVLAKLKELNLDEKTIVIFVSDNGGMAAANMGKPTNVVSAGSLDSKFSTSNLPLRGAKGWFYEGGIRVPLIVKWPQFGQHGAVSNVPVIGTDFYPTILEMLGLPQKPEQHVDGASLVPLLKGESTIRRKALYWHFPHYSNHGQQSPGGAIRSGDYKLLEYYEGNTVQLFNLKKDIGEQHDLAKSEPGKVRELRNLLHAWKKSVSAREMTPNPEYIPSTVFKSHRP
ncbi:sulfatase [Daejeonella sp.]|uniref:sulfatase n=1 Tax=Daejeonella sp. TaxID=2805397 RepID=UPI0030BFF4B8